MEVHQTAHIIATCDFCDHQTEIRATEVASAQSVACPICSNPLGTVAELHRPGREEGREVPDWGMDRNQR
jgi:hypothetical protein